MYLAKIAEFYCKYCSAFSAAWNIINIQLKKNAIYCLNCSNFDLKSIVRRFPFLILPFTFLAVNCIICV